MIMDFSSCQPFCYLSELTGGRFGLRATGLYNFHWYSPIDSVRIGLVLQVMSPDRLFIKLSLNLEQKD